MPDRASPLSRATGSSMTSPALRASGWSLLAATLLACWMFGGCAHLGARKVWVMDLRIPGADPNSTWSWYWESEALCRITERAQAVLAEVASTTIFASECYPALLRFGGDRKAVEMTAIPFLFGQLLPPALSASPCEPPRLAAPDHRPTPLCFHATVERLPR
jgi:hypothetical protein